MQPFLLFSNARRLAGVKSTNRRWSNVYKFLQRSGPYAADGFEPCQELIDFYHSCPLLIIGAGGLGCELLKNLGLLGFKDLHCIDMDTIDVSNLNRQFLFRQEDVGRPKVEAAAEFIMKRIPGCIVTPFFGKIQDKDNEYYSQFPVFMIDFRL